MVKFDKINTLFLQKKFKNKHENKMNSRAEIDVTLP